MIVPLHCTKTITVDKIAAAGLRLSNINALTFPFPGGKVNPNFRVLILSENLISGPKIYVLTETKSFDSSLKYKYEYLQQFIWKTGKGHK